MRRKHYLNIVFSRLEQILLQFYIFLPILAEAVFRSLTYVVPKTALQYFFTLLRQSLAVIFSSDVLFAKVKLLHQII